MIKRLYIEITNVCNLNCSFCKKNRRTPRFMSAEEFEHILNEIADVTKYIYLHVQGEPLLHPDLMTFMKIAEAHGCQVQLVTNALLLKDHMDLLDCEALRKISFSLQSVEFHDKDIQEFMDPVISLIKNASAQGRPYCELRFWRDDQMHLKRTEECLQRIMDEFHPSDSGRKNNFRILPGVYVDHSNPFDWPDIENSKTDEAGTCLGGISQLAVLSDGTLVPCCLDADGEIVLGNIFTQSMKEILASQRYIALTEGFRNHRLTEDLCRKCTFRHRFD